MDEFKAIETYSNWCYIDRLDGSDLADGDPVEVLWPDGSVTSQFVSVNRSRQAAMDHGRETYIPDSRAFLKSVVNGLQAVIPLRGSNLKLRRIEVVAPVFVTET